MPNTWKRFRYRLEWLGVWLLSTLIPLLPRAITRRVAKALGTAAYFLDGRGRETALENLRVVFGEKYGEKERRQIACKSFQWFTQTMVDQFWSPRLNSGNVDKYVRLELENPEAVANAKDSGAIWITPHYGNFEWTSLIMGLRGYSFLVLMQDFKNPHLSAIFRRNREKSGHEVISQEKSMLRLFKRLKQGGHAAFLPDLTVKPGDAATVIDCLGHKACVTVLHATLMRKARMPVIPGLSIPQEDGTYLIKGFHPLELKPGATDQELAQACWDVFEPYIRENPAPWLWMYKHWRFRPREGGERYPAYAQYSKKFDKMEKRLAREAAEAEAARAGQSST